jgi:N-formylglutamate amidohydrolase
MPHAPLPKSAAGDAADAPIALHEPDRLTQPLVFASPHSGRNYPAAFLRASRLDSIQIRRSEDSFVDEIFESAPRHGAPLLCALFPRAFVDVNREPYELDPAMFDGPLPSFANTRSFRVAGGLGTIARVVCDGQEIYSTKLSFDEAETRLERYYRPYHAQLETLLERAKSHFGLAVLVDCHSMPSVGGPMDEDPGSRRTDIVLGDRFGAACGPALTDLVDDVLTGFGYKVRRNAPYAGGFTTERYGKPRSGIHALQIEINRALYMDEARIERSAGLKEVKAHMGTLAQTLAEADLAALLPGRIRRR